MQVIRLRRVAVDAVKRNTCYVTYYLYISVYNMILRNTCCHAFMSSYILRILNNTCQAQRFKRICYYFYIF